MAIRWHHGVVLKSLHIAKRGRPPVAEGVRQSDVDALRSAVAVARVGLWPPPRR
jgi:hypothetical protein